MDISKMKPIKISPYASDKVMHDQFPTIKAELMLTDVKTDSEDLAMSAGALCLYATTLLTKIHENSPNSINCNCSARENNLISLIKNNPKYSNYSDLQISTMAHNLILRDIRNSFAHGNFEISYDKFSKKLNYILTPKRKDFITEEPIIISKKDLFSANKQYIEKLGLKYKILNNSQFNNKAKMGFGDDLKEFLLPVDMLRLSENYLDKSLKYFNKYKPTESRYFALYYPLLVAQLTYEQDDYYKLFNKNSNIFEKISHIRNAISHNGFKFDNVNFNITHIDRNKVSIDTLEKSVQILKLIRDHKNLVLYTKQKNFTEQDTQYLIDNIKTFFDSLFIEDNLEKEL